MKSPLLFTPITLRELHVRNRAWLAPMCQYSVDKQDGLPTSWHLQHLASRAAGGFGLVMTEATAVVPQGRISLQDTGMWSDDHTRAWAPIVDAIHAGHAAAGIQLAHAGRKASTYRAFPGEPTGNVAESDGGFEAFGPSAIPFDGLATPHELSHEQIDAVVTSFVDAARRSDEAGFDVIEIHAAHGYLIHEFLSPASNLRTDEYGGDLSGRATFLMRIASEIRAVWPASKPLFVRISATDWAETGWDINESVQLSAMLKQVGVDLIDVSSGGNVVAEIPVEPNYQVPFAAQIRTRADMPTSAVGLITEPDQAEQILAYGQADAVMLGRVALREPSWPLRAAHELGLSWREAPYPPQYARGAWPHVEE